MFEMVSVNKFKKLFTKFKKISPWRIAAVGLAIGLVIVVVAQLVFIETNSVVSRAKLDGQRIGSQRITDVQSRLEKQSQAVQLKLGDEQKSYPASDTGVELEVKDTMATIPRVTLRDKLIPFAPLARSLVKHNTESVIKRDGTKIRYFADKIVIELHKDPVDAKAEVKDGKLVLTEAIPGRDFNTEVIQDVLHNRNVFTVEAPVVAAISSPAKLQKKELEVLQPQFDKIAAQKLKVSYGDKTAEIDAKTVTSLLVATNTPEGWKLTMREDAAIALAQNWAKEYNIPSGVTQVEMYDGLETSRRVGASGRMIDQKAVVTKLNQWLAAPTAEVVPIPTAVVPPKVVYSRFYSQSSAGLQAKLDAWIQSHGGGYQVAIQELGGQGRTATYNVEKQTIMASTYKIFLAFVAYRQAETGSISLDYVVYNGKTIEQCLELAVVQSNNECPQAVGKYIGWAKVDEVIAAAGFQGVKLNNYTSSGALSGDKLVNAREQAKFLRQLSAGTLMNGSNTDRLVGYMKRQIYRSGIPAGSRGAVVADKVGFLPEVTHDVGIVYGTKSTYALVIMSNGANNWANIRDLAQAVYDFMNE